MTPSGEALIRRLKRAVVALSLLLIAVVAVAWLHGSDEASLNPIAQAARLTQRQPGSRIAIAGSYTPQPGAQALAMHGAGVYNGRSGASRQWMTIEVPGSMDSVRMVALGNRQMIYLRSPQLSAELPPGETWLGVQAGLSSSTQEALANNMEARDQLEMLRATSDGVDEVGSERVRGTSTTHYRGSVELTRAAELLAEEGQDRAAREYTKLAEQMPAPIPVDAWIDDAGLLRRLTMAMSFSPAPGAQPVQMNLTMEFFDFGIEPAVDLPRPGEVFDSTPLSRAGLHLLDGSTVGVPARPSAAPALSAAAYRRRANELCVSNERRQKPLEGPARALSERIVHLVRGAASGEGDREALLEALRQYASRFDEPAIRVGRREMRRFAQLAPPAALRPPIQRLLHFVAVALEVTLAETRAMELGALRTARQLQPRLKSAQRGARRAGREAGLGPCFTESKSS
jgi:hypothetical protein